MTTDTGGHEEAELLAAAHAGAPARRESVRELRQWLRQAQPRARRIYGHGSMVAQCVDKELREWVLAMYEAGYLTPHHVRLGPGVAVQIVVRTAKPVRAGARL